MLMTLCHHTAMSNSSSGRFLGDLLYEKAKCLQIMHGVGAGAIGPYMLGFRLGFAMTSTVHRSIKRASISYFNVKLSTKRRTVLSFDARAPIPTQDSLAKRFNATRQLPSSA